MVSTGSRIDLILAFQPELAYNGTIDCGLMPYLNSKYAISALERWELHETHVMPAAGDGADAVHVCTGFC